jgi:hypothetical protein
MIHDDSPRLAHGSHAAHASAGISAQDSSNDVCLLSRLQPLKLQPCLHRLALKPGLSSMLARLVSIEPVCVLSLQSCDRELLAGLDLRSVDVWPWACPSAFESVRTADCIDGIKRKL